MATSDENDLIGYDPLAWMEGNTDKNEETTNNECCESDNKQEGTACDNEIRRADTYSDDLIGSIEESAILKVAKADELVVDGLEDEKSEDLIEEMVVDSVLEEMDEPLFDLDATLTIQNVVKLHEKLKSFLAVHDQIEINASDVSSIDTATLQLLVSLKKDATKLQKKVTIIYPSPRFVESAQLLDLLDVLEVHEA